MGRNWPADTPRAIADIKERKAMTATAEETAREIVRTTDLNNVERGQRLIDKITAALLAHGAAERARAVEECAKFIRDEEMPKYTEIAKQVNGNLYQIEEALAAAYRHGLRYKHEMEIQRRVDNTIRALASAGPGEG